MGKKKRNANRKVVSRRAASVQSTKKYIADTQQPTLYAASIRGLVNLGNTCFLNSSLQSLNAVIDYLDVTISSPIYSAFCGTLLALRGKGSKAVNPSHLLSSISSGYTNFRDRRQHDAHELLVYLISGLQDEEREEKREEDPSDSGADRDRDLQFSTFFGGSLASIVECKQCGQRSCSTDSFIDLSLHIPGSSHLYRSRSLNAIKKSISAARNKDCAGMPTKPSVVSPTLSTGHNDKNAQHVSDMTEPLAESAEEKQSSDGLDKSSDTDCGDDASCNAATEEDTLKCSTLPESPVSPVVVYDILEPPVDVWAQSCTTASPLSVYSCLKDFTSREILLVQDGNGIICSSCSVPCSLDDFKGDASKRVLLLDESLPPVLALHFKRLLPGGKFSSHIEFDMTLDVSPFIGRKVQPLHPVDPSIVTNGAYFDCSNVMARQDKTVTDDNVPSSPLPPSSQEGARGSPLYGLRAVIVHKGGASGGHYVAYVQREGSWFYTSDTSTKPVGEAEVLKCEAYILIYRQMQRTVDEESNMERIENDEMEDACPPDGEVVSRLKEDEDSAEVDVQVIVDKLQRL